MHHVVHVFVQVHVHVHTRTCSFSLTSFGVESDLLQERCELCLTLLVPLLRPEHCWVVHLINEHHQVLHTSRLCQHGMLSCLTPSFEPRLKLSLSGRDDQYTNVSLSSTTDHVWNKASMARGV